MVSESPRRQRNREYERAIQLSRIYPKHESACRATRVRDSSDYHVSNGAIGKGEGMESKINKHEILGLLIVAKRHLDAMKECEMAIAERLGVQGDEHGYYGHVSDVVWGGSIDVNDLLRRLELKP